MASASTVSLLLRPDLVAGQMAKEARLKRLQQVWTKSFFFPKNVCDNLFLNRSLQVRDAEKAASKAQRARYNERKGNAKRTERSIEFDYLTVCILLFFLFLFRSYFFLLCVCFFNSGVSRK